MNREMKVLGIILLLAGLGLAGPRKAFASAWTPAAVRLTSSCFCLAPR